MIRRSRKYRKRFACGHRGYGRYCHRCADRAARRRAAWRVRQTQRRVWQETFSDDPIELRHLPPAIAEKTRQIVSALEQGTGHWQLAGKRLSVREVISIPVTYRYRLLCREEGDRVVPVKVMSHEDYNPLANSSKRLRHSVLRYNRRVK